MEVQQKTFWYWLVVEDGKPVKFSDLALMMAKALEPNDDFTRGFRLVNLEDDLKRAVKDGRLQVRNGLDLGPHTFPFGQALQDSVLLPHDLEPFLNDRGMGLRIIPHASGPVYWTLEHAAAAIARQEGWHGGAQESFLTTMEVAANQGDLVVRDPHTDLPVRKNKVHRFYETLKASDVNAWLKKQDAPYRWREKSAVDIQSSDVPAAQPKPTGHSTKSQRNDILAPVIVDAASQCNDPQSVAEVWGKLVRMAESASKGSVLLAVDEEGIRYLDGKGGTAYLTREALRKRMKRAREGR